MRKLLPAGVALLMLGLSACATNPGSTQPAGTTAPSTAAAASPSATAGPSTAASTADRAAKTAEVRKQLPAEKPAKVVILSVPLTQILDALDVTPVGVISSQYKLPERLAKVPRVGMSTSPDIEKITQLQPDLVIGPASIKDSLTSKLQPTKLKSAYVPTDSLDALIATTLAFGDLFDSLPKAEALVAAADKAQQDAIAKQSNAGVKVLVLFGSPEELMVVGEGTYVGGIIKALGASNIASQLGAQGPYTPLSLEKVIVADPDTILFLAHGDPAESQKAIEGVVAKNSAWQGLRAVKEKRLKAIPGTLFSYSASLTTTPEAFQVMSAALAK